MTNAECSLVKEMLPPSRDCDPERRKTPGKGSVFVTEKRLAAAAKRLAQIQTDAESLCKRLASMQVRIKTADAVNAWQ